MSRLSEQERAALGQLGFVQHIRPGTQVLAQGERSEHALVLLSGAVKVVFYTHDGAEVLLAIRVGGDLVGEMGAMERAPRSATVVACAKTRLRRIEGDVFRRFLEGHPRAAVQVACMVGNRLRWANDRRADMTAHDARTRIARVLVEIARTYGGSTGREWRLGVDLTQRDIASLAGVALRTNEKVLKELEKDDHVIRRAYRSVVVTDMAGLEAVARMTAQNPY